MAHWIKWDIDSRLGVKMAGFVAENGALGYGIFVILIEMLYRAEDSVMQIDANSCKSMQSYARLCKCDANQFLHILNELVECDLLKQDGINVWSERVLEEKGLMKSSMAEVSKKRQLAAITRWNGEKCKTMQNDAKVCKPMQTNANDARLDKNRLDNISILDKSNIDNTISDFEKSSFQEQENNLKSKKKIKQEKESVYKVFNLADFQIPTNWNDQAVQALKIWIEYKAKSGTAKLLMSYQTELNKFINKPSEYIKLVERATARGWKGLCEDVPLQNQGSYQTNLFSEQKKSVSQSNIEKGLQALSDFIDEVGK